MILILGLKTMRCLWCCLGPIYLSQAAIVHLYDIAVEGVKGYHTILLGKLEIDGKKILPPSRP